MSSTSAEGEDSPRLRLPQHLTAHRTATPHRSSTARTLFESAAQTGYARAGRFDEALAVLAEAEGPAPATRRIGPTRCAAAPSRWCARARPMPKSRRPSRLTRGRPTPRREAIRAVYGDELRPLAPRPQPWWGRSRAPRADLKLVHRRLRHPRSAGREGAARGVVVITTSGLFKDPQVAGQCDARCERARVTRVHPHRGKCGQIVQSVCDEPCYHFATTPPIATPIHEHLAHSESPDFPGVGCS